MSEIVCQVGNRADQVEFIWSSRGGYFKPYVVAGTQLTELRQAADQTRTALESLVFALNRDGAATPWEPSFELAEAGFRLFNYLLPSEDETAHKVRRWLEDLWKQSGLIGLEVVVEERSADAGTFLSVPWNLVYDERPAKYKAAFQKGQGVERWRPFWSARYNLTSGRRVEPLKRLPLWIDPRVVVVVDPTVHEGLNDEQKGRLDGFLAEAGLTAVGSLDELEAALEEGYPRLLYWLGHATPEYLMLGDKRIAPGDLRNLLRSFDDRERPEGMLAFLNACQTAESGSGGSFLDVLHSFGFTGAIATERQTIDTFANEFGLAFLQGFLREGKPLGELLHGLRLQSAPLGLLYGAHCPPEIRVRSGDGAAAVPAPLPIRESGPVSGVALGAATLWSDGSDTAIADRTWAAPLPVAAPPLPHQPYRSLAYFDENDRALFTGRDADVVRFAATLDRPDTRILILHGESGTGKSSFLRAGVIPYLEEECVGYRFFRRPDGAVLIVQAAKDLVGQLAQALLDATATSLRYDTPDGEPHTVNLRRVLDEVLGTTADYATLREALRRDVHLLADMISRMAGRLPYALVLVLDQAEEVFTLAKTPEEVAGRDHGLRMLQRLVDVQADVKLIVALRTEYYGRLLDHLRAGRRDLTGVRDDLLRDFSRSALIEAITRPTSETPLAPGQPAPREQYGFRYAEGIPEADRRRRPGVALGEPGQRPAFGAVRPARPLGCPRVLLDPLARSGAGPAAGHRRSRAADPRPLRAAGRDHRGGRVRAARGREARRQAARRPRGARLGRDLGAAAGQVGRRRPPGPEAPRGARPDRDPQLADAAAAPARGGRSRRRQADPARRAGARRLRHRHGPRRRRGGAPRRCFCTASPARARPRSTSARSRRRAAAGKGALVLVPEIALTPQLAARFRARFGDEVAVLHSGLADGERLAAWKRLRAGEARIALGARSAVFAPVADLGLVVVDEEHDSSFKQEEGVRYHARDMALVRAQRAGAVCVLGSATPSLESYANARDGRYRLLELPGRAHARPLPTVELVESPDLPARGGEPPHCAARRALAATLAAGEQAILFLNRRGFSPFVVCCGCGHAFRCPHCSVSLTYHRAGEPAPLPLLRVRPPRAPELPALPRGGDPALGLGTERVEEALRERFPTARIARLDRDTAGASGGRGLGRVLSQVARREIDILVGTQMVTKGHDFPGVTLVGVLIADAALSLPDFRAAERTFQLLVQVAGRAGRGDRPGRVLIQTYAPSTPRIPFAARHDLDGFLERELGAAGSSATRRTPISPGSSYGEVGGEAARASGASPMPSTRTSRARPSCSARRRCTAYGAPPPCLLFKSEEREGVVTLQRETIDRVLRSERSATSPGQRRHRSSVGPRMAWDR